VTDVATIPPGFDHGVYMPFLHILGNTFTDIPTVEISIDSSLKPEKELALGAAVAELRFVEVPSK
jgi:aromatic ring-opening dioxygenase catalytic subunit (LigB family)